MKSQTIKKVIAEFHLGDDIRFHILVALHIEMDGSGTLFFSPWKQMASSISSAVTPSSAGYLAAVNDEMGFRDCIARQYAGVFSRCIRSCHGIVLPI